MSQEFNNYNNEQMEYQKNFQLDEKANSAKTMGTVSLIMAFFVPIVCWICGAIGIKKSKEVLAVNPEHEIAKKAKKNCKNGIIISIVLYVVLIVIYGVAFGLMMSSDGLEEYDDVYTDDLYVDMGDEFEYDEEFQFDEEIEWE